MRIGVISDTHGLFRLQVAEWFTGVDHIVHAGDLGAPGIVAQLSQFAPVTAIRGNVDTADWAAAYPSRAIVELAGRSIYVLHDLKALDLDPAGKGFDVVISGHSHQPGTETVADVLYLNPGSAGPRRFNLPVTLAVLDLTGGAVRAAIREIDR